MKTAQEWVLTRNAPIHPSPDAMRFVEQIQADARESALREAANAVKAYAHTPECLDDWSITRSMAFHESETAILKLLNPSKQ